MSVLVDEQPCVIRKISNTEVLCRTPPFPSDRDATVQVCLGRAFAVLHAATFPVGPGQSAKLARNEKRLRVAQVLAGVVRQEGVLVTPSRTGRPILQSSDAETPAAETASSAPPPESMTARANQLQALRYREAQTPKIHRAELEFFSPGNGTVRVT